MRINIPICINCSLTYLFPMHFYTYYCSHFDDFGRESPAYIVLLFCLGVVNLTLLVVHFLIGSTSPNIFLLTLNGSESPDFKVLHYGRSSPDFISHLMVVNHHTFQPNHLYTVYWSTVNFL